MRVDAVVNCAAYTLVDQAEKEPERCRALNVDVVRELAEACQARGSTLVQISTDYVFGADRSRSTPYRESDPPGPQGAYARSKLDGEIETARCESHLIVRTCGLYGRTPRRNNFVETMLRLGVERPLLRVVNDQRCTPSFVGDVARAVIFLLHSKANGIYHVVNAGETTWFEFAREIFRQAQMKVQLEAITTEEYGAPADRPRYSVLSTSKYEAAGGPPLQSWQDALAEYLLVRQVPDSA
jgi:dTDP-4-dehydrorhamnose reductase